MRGAPLLSSLLFVSIVSLFCFADSRDGDYSAVGSTPPLGWSTWETCGDDACMHDFCSEWEVKMVAESMKHNGLVEMGYRTLILDDCWALNRNETTKRLQWDPKRFPSGIPALVSWLKQQDNRFVLGLYTSAGNATCSSGGRPVPIPGSRSFYDIDAMTFAEWGIGYIKLDWCGDIKKEVLRGKQAHIDFAAAVKAAENKTGSSIFLEVVAGYFFLGTSISQYANAWRFCTDHHDSWSSSQENVLCRIDQPTSLAGKPRAWPYMDVLAIGGKGCAPFSSGPHCPGQTDDEYRSNVALWSLLQSPMIVATDVRNMTPIMTETLLNKDIIAIHQSTATPPGRHLGYWPCDSLVVGACQIWARELDQAASEWLVALVNIDSNKSHKITLEFSSKLGFSGTGSVKELWSGAIQNASDAFEAVVPSHGTSLLRVKKT